MEENTKEKKSFMPMIVVALIGAVIGAGATYAFTAMRNPNASSNNVTGTWYSTYAGQTFILSLKKDKTFEYGYDGQDMTTGKFSNAKEDVLTLTTDQGPDKIIYALGKDYIEINSTKYYSTKEAASKNDSYYYVPDDYDVSMFTKISAEEMIKKFNNGDAAFVLTARGSCGYCQQFRPVAAESVKKYNYTLYYLDTTTLTEDDYTKIRALDSQLAEFGSTPNVYYFKGKKIVDIQQGAADADTYGEFLKKNGVKAK